MKRTISFHLFKTPSIYFVLKYSLWAHLYLEFTYFFLIFHIVSLIQAVHYPFPIILQETSSQQLIQAMTMAISSSTTSLNCLSSLLTCIISMQIILSFCLTRLTWKDLKWSYRMKPLIKMSSWCNNLEKSVQVSWATG